MIDENQNQNQSEKSESSVADYISAIAELKKNTIPREEYEKLQQERKELLNAVVNGEQIEAQKNEDVDVDKIREELLGDEKLSNLDYVKKTLELRKEIIDKTGKDVFLPFGNQIIPTTDDIEASERVANILQECVDYANGDSQLFTNELSRRTIDVKIR